tara:strand:- start:59 stop:439 length:381 start_codon:yes stop_codon:yes gene_type:complete
MKQYFTGFFTALCLSISLFMVMKNEKDENSGSIDSKIILNGDSGKTVIEGGSMRIFNQDGKEIAFIGVCDRLAGKVQLKNKLGYKIASMGAWYGDGFSGNGYVDVNDAYGQYGWSVIGKVSPGHYQ